MTDQEKHHVFISYVRENQKEVDRLCHDLESHGVNVWLDRNDITPGIFWEDAIRKAIRDGAFFIACFSEEYKEKTSTHMNEELNLAIEVLRKRRREQAWFLPVVLSGDVPDWEIFPGKTLQSIQWVPLYEAWDAGIQRILSVIKPISPEIQNLVSALLSKDKNVRRQAGEALRANDSLLWWTAEALEKIDSKAKAAVPALIEALKDEDYEVRWRATQALGQIGRDAKAAVPALIEILKDKNVMVRQGAAQALGEIDFKANRAAVPALIEALKKEDNDRVRMAVNVALEKIKRPVELTLLDSPYRKSLKIRFFQLIFFPRRQGYHEHSRGKALLEVCVFITY